MLKKVSFFALVAMIFFSAFTREEALANSLKDIPANYAAEINYLVEEGIVSGYPDGTFKPNNSVTRAEATKMVGVALDLNGEQTDSTFPDVDASFYASGYIESALAAGIIGGYPDNTFKPNRNISRGEMAIILSRAFQLKDYSDVQFKDVAKTDSEYISINKIYTAGITVGYPDGTYKPKSSITRGEFSVMIARAIDPLFKVGVTDGSTIKYVLVTTSLNVRSGPGTTHSIIGKLYNNDEVVVTDNSNDDGDWVYITAGDLSGYVHKDYLIDTKQIIPDIPISQRVVAIDAGHGGHDPGASANGLTEKVINLEVAKYAQSYLEKEGIKVFMTRKDDTFISLDGRVALAVAAGADTFVSIHGNAASSSANGTETYYSTAALNPRAAASKKLSEFIQDRLVAALGTKDRGVKEAGFRVIKTNPLPATLLELGFLTNKSDAEILLKNKQAAGKAISLGIVDYYKWLEK